MFIGMCLSLEKQRNKRNGCNFLIKTIGYAVTQPLRSGTQF